jgi:hypothetical protein
MKMASRFFIIETKDYSRAESSNVIFEKLISVVGKDEAKKILTLVEVEGKYTITGSGEVVTIKKPVN